MMTMKTTGRLLGRIAPLNRIGTSRAGAVLFSSKSNGKGASEGEVVVRRPAAAAPSLFSAFSSPFFGPSLFDTNFFRSPFDDMFQSHRDLMQEQKQFIPKVDVHETDTEWKITVEVPGIPKEETKIELKNNQLVISGHHEEKVMGEDSKEGKPIVKERREGSFVRSFSIPESVKSSDIAASHKDGILTVTVKKGEPPVEPQPEQIKID